MAPRRGHIAATLPRDEGNGVLSGSSHEEEEDNAYEVYNITAEMTVTERLLACLKNPAMTDVALIGDDGIAVPASRYILGSTSTVLQPLLYGGVNLNRTTEPNVLANHKNKHHRNQEKPNSRDRTASVNIRESNHRSLQALVEFCCSDELNTDIWMDYRPVEMIHDNVALAKLAHTYEIPKLQEKIQEFLIPVVQECPSLSCLVFHLADEAATPSIYQAALDIILDDPCQSFPPAKGVHEGGLACTSPEKLDFLLGHANLEAEDFFLFQQLVVWRDENKKRFKNVHSICRHMVVQHIDLSAINPNEIETTVMQSGFVDSNMLVQALMRQAKATASVDNPTNSPGEKPTLSLSAQRRKAKKQQQEEQTRQQQEHQSSNKDSAKNKGDFKQVLVEHAGEEECNGIYVYIHVPQQVSNDKESNTPRSNNLLYFVKRSETAGGKTFVLVKDSIGTWRICDNSRKILYERVKSQNENENEGPIFPAIGWDQVTGALPVPICAKYMEEEQQERHVDVAKSNCHTKTEPLPQPVRKSFSKPTFGVPPTSPPGPSTSSVEQGNETRVETFDMGLFLKTGERNPKVNHKDKALADNVRAQAKEKKKGKRSISLMDDEDEEIKATVGGLIANQNLTQAAMLDDPLLGKEVGGTGFKEEMEDFDKSLLKVGSPDHRQQTRVAARTDHLHTTPAATNEEQRQQPHQQSHQQIQQQQHHPQQKSTSIPAANTSRPNGTTILSDCRDGPFGSIADMECSKEMKTDFNEHLEQRLQKVHRQKGIVDSSFHDCPGMNDEPVLPGCGTGGMASGSSVSVASTKYGLKFEV